MLQATVIVLIGSQIKKSKAFDFPFYAAFKGDVNSQTYIFSLHNLNMSKNNKTGIYNSSSSKKQMKKESHLLNIQHF